MDEQSFVEWGNSQFSPRAVEAARHGRLNAEPLLDLLQKAHDVSRGLQQIFKIAKANRIQERAWADKDDNDESMEPPMHPNTVDSLLALGQVASAMVEIEVERLSTWLDKHGVQEPDPVADLAIAAQAAVAPARRSRIAMPETESETA